MGREKTKKRTQSKISALHYTLASVKNMINEC